MHNYTMNILSNLSNKIKRALGLEPAFFVFWFGEPFDSEPIKSDIISKVCTSLIVTVDYPATPCERRQNHEKQSYSQKSK